MHWDLANSRVDLHGWLNVSLLQSQKLKLPY